MQNVLVKISKDREVVGVFKTGNFSSRPNVLIYPDDITAMVKTGVIEFHGSIERWSQPMSLKPENYNELRTGWDLILDIDCDFFEHAKIAVEAFIWALKKHEIKNVFVKFTGGKGFHIGIPWESIPETIDYKPSVKLYPDLARQIVSYLKEFSRERLERSLLKKWMPEELSEQAQISADKFLTESGIDPYKIVDIDPILISQRHLFRLPYSLHRKSFLASLPLRPENLEGFRKEDADPGKIKVKEGFLDRSEPNELETLISEAVDWRVKKKSREKKTARRTMVLERTIPVELFPPCMKNILEGLTEGRKRSVFILLNFLRSAQWKWEDIENLILAWNQKNKPPINENYIRSQIRWHRSRNKAILPPNCYAEGWYTEFGVCKPDDICVSPQDLKNPIKYPWKILKKEKPISKKSKYKKSGG